MKWPISPTIFSSETQSGWASQIAGIEGISQGNGDWGKEMILQVDCNLISRKKTNKTFRLQRDLNPQLSPGN